MADALASLIGARPRLCWSTASISRSVSPRAPASAIAIAVPIEYGENTILPGPAAKSRNSA